MIGDLEEGNQLSILISREDVLYELKVTMLNYERPQYQFLLVDDENTNKLKKTWLSLDK